MKTNPVKLPKFIIVIAALVAVAAFFLPYISMTNDYRNALGALGDVKPFTSCDITYNDMKDLSLFEYTKLYIQAGGQIFNDPEGSRIIGYIIVAIGVCPLLMILTGLAGRPLLTALFDAGMFGTFRFFTAYIEGAGVMPDPSKEWGIAYRLYIPLAAVICVAAIWLLIAKKIAKKAAAGPTITTDNTNAA